MKNEQAQWFSCIGNVLLICLKYLSIDMFLNRDGLIFQNINIILGWHYLCSFFLKWEKIDLIYKLKYRFIDIGIFIF